MDYRERCYYLIDLQSDKNNDKINLMRRVAPSLKIHPPYNHWNDEYESDKLHVNNCWFNNTTIHCINISCLVSVRKEDNYYFKCYLDYMSKAKETFYFKVDKTNLTQ